MCAMFWTDGGARDFELKTSNVLRLMLTLSFISVPNVITFLQAVLCAAIDSAEEAEAENEWIE